MLISLNSVDGGELFDRIIDENYKLTELDTVMFTRQICEGLRYLHKMYILHLDLKVQPETQHNATIKTLTSKKYDLSLALRGEKQPTFL